MVKKSIWQDPCEDMLEVILRKVSYFELASFSAVCSSWCKATKTHKRGFSRPILLSIANNQTDSDGLRVRTLPEGDALSLSEEYRHFYCIGRSKELLVLADMKTRTELVLVDRFCQFAPSAARSPVLGFCRLNSVTRDFFQINISKTVVLRTCENNNNNNNNNKPMDNIVVVAILNNPRSCLAFYRGGSWELLDCSIKYYDIVARGRRLYAVDIKNSVKVWDFNESGPTTVMRFKSSKRMPIPPTRVHRYLVESKGEFLLVERYLFDNSAVAPRAMLSDRNFNWFSTVGFKVYKSGLTRGEKWVEVDSLGDDVALFVGRNESVSVSTRDLPAGNSIYFTHDYLVNCTYDVNSREIGVYSLEHKKIKFFHGLYDDLDGPTPVWMV